MCWISSNVPFFSTNNSSSCRRAFYINRANNGTINSTSSVAFSTRSMERGNSGEGSPSICEVVSSSPNASVRVMFRQRPRRFFCSSEVDDGNFIRRNALLITFLNKKFRTIPEDPLIRLPTDVIPIHYELHFKIYLPYKNGIDYGERNFTFDGNLRLHLLCRQTTNVLLLHSKSLEIDYDKATIWMGGGTIRLEGPRIIGWKELAGRNDLLEMRLDRALLPGRNYILELGYKAKIGKNSQEGGLYQSHYLNEANGENRYIAATQMQPLDARKLLPCFDEPSFKAEFSISVQHPDGTVALSNAPIEHTRNVERTFYNYVDIFGVPSLRVAAMENWGLIICRQQNLFYIDGVQARRDKQFVTDVLAHEIAHMAPTGQSQLFYEHTVKAFRFDQVAHQAHALSYKISSVREVARRFDRITYLKAAAVLRMVEHTVGENIFREGLRSFLRNYKFKNARSDDLIRFMDSWTYQTGFPLIQLIALNSTAVIASQVQFFYLQEPSSNPSSWKVPLFINGNTTNNGSEDVIILERDSVILHRYQLASRARLLEDAFTIARTGLISFELAFKMSEYLVEEKEYLPLLVFNNHLQHLLLLLRNHNKSYLIRSFILEMLETQFHRLFSSHFTNNADISDTLREFAMVQLCQWNYPPCIGHSLREFSRVRSACRDRKMSDQKIPPELRGPVYSTAIRHGNIDDFDFLWSKYLIEEYDSERGRILSGLVGTTDIKLVELSLNRFIENIRNTTLIGFNPEDFYAFLLKFVRSPILNDVVDSMKRNFRMFANKIPNTLLMKVILTFITKWMNSESDLAELKEFEIQHKKVLTELRLLDYLHEQITEIRANEDFVNKYAQTIIAYLEKRKDERNLEKQKINKCQPLIN
uniref:Aminopeptidase n=1 Tax=Meloidogyne floridensis TaxID=298350 RepID=A0A915NTH6_9BILA